MSGASFGELLRQYRVAAGLTQAALAEQAGLSEQAVSLLERGVRKRPRRDTIHALSVALGLDRPSEQRLVVAVQAERKPRTTAPADASPPPVGRAGTPVVPRQLPPTVADFTGRRREMQAVLKALRQAEGAITQVVITGMGGIGKTALAVETCHQVADRFPDGLLYVKLRGHDPGAALTSEEALEQLLRTLGVRQDGIPAGVDEMAGLYRSRLAGRRILILLDDAISAEQVSPLLPGDAGCAIIVTSRNYLSSLPGSVVVHLSAFSRDDSIGLLSAVVGESAVRAEPAAADRLVELTGGLPLALRLIAARLVTRPAWRLQHLVDQLENAQYRLDQLGRDESGVRATFAGSVDELATGSRPVDRAAATAFDLLSLVQGARISVPLIARLQDKTEAEVEQLLERLVDLNLLESVGPREYRMHDLLRAHATERLDRPDRAAERAAAIERGLMYYAASAWRVQQITHPWSTRRPPIQLDDTGAPVFEDMASAVAWLDAEYESLMDLYRQAGSTPELARRFGPSLALGLFGYLEAQASWQRMRVVYDLAIASVDRKESTSTLGWLLHDRVIPDVEQGLYEPALLGLLRALQVFDEAGDLGGTARCLSSLSHVCERLDRIEEAIGWGERGRSLAEQQGDEVSLGANQLALGVLYLRAGRPEDAARAFELSFELARRHGNLRSQARRFRVAATSYIAARRYRQAAEFLDLALSVFRTKVHDPVGLAETLQHLGEAKLGSGDVDAAEQAVQEGIRVTDEAVDPFRRAQLLGLLARIRATAGRVTEARELEGQAEELLESQALWTSLSARPSGHS